jgi:hypothetical protein
MYIDCAGIPDVVDDEITLLTTYSASASLESHFLNDLTATIPDF